MRRAFFWSPIQGDVAMTQMGIALAITLWIPWCQLHGANIFVDFFTQRLSTRRQRWLDALLLLLVPAISLWLVTALIK